MTTHKLTLGRRVAAAAVTAGLVASVACHGAITDALLVAQQPAVISPSAINTPAGATAAYFGAMGRLEVSTGGSESPWLFGGLLADEFTSSSTFIQNDEADERAITLANSSILSQFRGVEQLRTAVDQALPVMKQYNPTPLAPIAELYLARGYAEMELADNYCNGVPLSDGANNEEGSPLTGTAIYTKALATIDSGRALVNGLTDANSVNIFTALNILKARVYVSLGDFPDAIALTGPIATTYEYDITYSTTNSLGSQNILWSQATSQRRYNIGDTTVTNAGTLYRVFPALPFSTAKDPRLGVVSNTPTGVLSQDGSVISRTTSMWTQTSSTPLVNGIDARLIEAEAFLKTGDVTDWLATLNTLRSTAHTLSAAGGLVYNAGQLPALTDPGATAANPQGTAVPARLYLMFYEKAFWTFGRGQRLSDMRRLIRQYAIPVTAIFPQGTHYRGPPYGPDVNMPVPFNENVNPNFHGCIDRNA